MKIEFAPKFELIGGTNAIEVCADMINRPHEDYPQRVPMTLTALKILIDNKLDLIISFEAKQIHSIIFPKESFRGKWRECNVKIGDEIPPHFLDVPNLIESIFPAVRFRDLEPRKTNYLINWYKQFQTIHPFQDGNGRVGGVIVAALSWDGKTLLSPLQ